MIQLSPLVLADMHHKTLLLDDAGSTLVEALRKKNGRTREIIEYECGDCGERYLEEDEADKCCMPELVQSSPNKCPVCLEDSAWDEFVAADCCLWKDIAPADRFRIAMAVRRGAEWADAIAEVTGDRRVLS